MCDMCSKLTEGDVSLELKVGDKKYDLGSRSGVLEFALDMIRESSPDIAIILNAMEDVTGHSVLGDDKMDPSTLTVRDIVGTLILLKMLSNMGGHPAITLKCFELSATFASLPQMANINPPNEKLSNGKFSTVQLVNCIPRPN